jgi:hypothetical protein
LINFGVVKKLWSYITCISLSLAILAVSSGFTLSRMVCLRSGHSLLLMGAQDDCCKHNRTPGAVISGRCCEVFNQDLSVGNFLAGMSKSALQQVYAIPVSPVFLPPSVIVFREVTPLAAGPSPPGASPDLLLHICKHSV